MKRFLYTVVLSTALVSLSPAQTFVVLHTFTGTPDGATPYGALIRDTKSNLYGTTALGGTYNAGTVFKLRATGTEAASYSFGRSGDGYGPVAGLVRDRAGNLYGTTAGGGAWGNGAVFKIDISGKETLLYSFKATYSGDGAAPGYGSLLLDSAADLYGTTASGGLGGCGYDEFCGTVFKVDLGGNETVLYRFGGVDDGWGPLGGLIQDPAGNLYGTTPNGGPYSNPCGNTGCGVVFKLTPVGVETRLYSFGAFSGDASGPTATLVRDTKGNLYGTSVYGGTNFAGTVFRLTGGGMESVLHSFLGENSNGAFPRAGLIRDPRGNLYGTTVAGGTYNAGTVFKLDAAGNVTVLYTFTGGLDGGAPVGNLALDTVGNLYGTASSGGASGYGTVFELLP